MGGGDPVSSRAAAAAATRGAVARPRCRHPRALQVLRSHRRRGPQLARGPQGIVPQCRPRGPTAPRARRAGGRRVRPGVGRALSARVIWAGLPCARARARRRARLGALRPAAVPAAAATAATTLTCQCSGASADGSSSSGGGGAWRAGDGRRRRAAPRARPLWRPGLRRRFPHAFADSAGRRSPQVDCARQRDRAKSGGPSAVQAVGTARSGRRVEWRHEPRPRDHARAGAPPPRACARPPACKPHAAHERAAGRGAQRAVLAPGRY